MVYSIDQHVVYELNCNTVVGDRKLISPPQRLLFKLKQRLNLALFPHGTCRIYSEKTFKDIFEGQLSHKWSFLETVAMKIIAVVCDISFQS